MTKWSAGLGMLAMLPLLVGCPDDPEPEPDPEPEEVVVEEKKLPPTPEVLALAEKDREKALALIEDALERTPRYARALGLRAWVRLERDRRDRLVSSVSDQAASLEDANQALKLDDDQYPARLAHAVLWGHEGKLQGAVTAATQTVDRAPKWLEARMVLAVLHLRRREGAAARKVVEGVLKASPKHARALVILAGLHIEQGDYALAYRLLDKADRNDPDLPQADFQRGLIHLKASPRKPAQAVKAFSRALKLSPKWTCAWFFRAQARHDERDYEAALEDLGKVDALQPGESVRDPAQVHVLRGHCHYERQEWPDPVDSYTLYFELNPPMSSPGFARAKARLKRAQAKMR